MSHGPIMEWAEEKSSGFKSKLGIYMFLIYTFVYVGFIAINLIEPKLMAVKIGSQNIAIIYGLGLIVFAIILALIYNSICTKAERRMDTTSDGDKNGI